LKVDGIPIASACAVELDRNLIKRIEGLNWCSVYVWVGDILKKCGLMKN